MSDKEERLIAILKDTLCCEQAPHILNHCVIQGDDIYMNDKYHLNKINDEWCVYSVVDGNRIEEISLTNCFSACILYIANVVMDNELCAILQNKFITLAAPLVKENSDSF